MSRRDRQPSYLRSAPPRTRKRRGRGEPHSTRRDSEAPGFRVLVALLVIALLAGGATWVITRPVSLNVTATPDDASIRVLGMPDMEGIGVLSAEGVSPGSYTLEVARSGFETRTAQVDVKRLRGAKIAVALEPLPQAITVTSYPDEAACRVLRDGDELLSGTTALSGEVLAGVVTVELSLTGYNALSHEVFVDSPTDLELWMDPEGQVVHLLGITKASGAPKGIAITPDGTEVWATILDGPPSIEIFDTKTRSLAGVVDLGTHGAVEVVFSADGSRAYASQMETARVFEIDTATREVVRTLETGSAWSKVVELAPDGSAAYVANWSGNDVSVIDLHTGELQQRIPVARTPRGLHATADGGSLFVAGFAQGDLQRIDLASGDVTTLFSSGGAMRHIVGDAERGVLFASDMAKDRIWLHDLGTAQTSEFADTDAKPNTIALSPDRKVLFVSCRGANNPVSYYIPGPEWGSILLIDTATGEPLDAIVGGNQCTALDVSDDGRLLVFSDFLDSTLRFYEIPSYETLAEGGGGRYGEHRAALKK